MPRGLTKCPYCGKTIISIYSKHHQKVCRVRRGLDKRPAPIPVNPNQMTLDQLIDPYRETGV